MFPELVFRASGHCLFGRLRLFIALGPAYSRADRLELSLKLYHACELRSGCQQLMAEAPEKMVLGWTQDPNGRIFVIN